MAACPADADGRATGLADYARDQLARTVAILGPGAVAVAFNGGKDCTAALHLLHEALTDADFRQVRLVYFRPESEFAEVYAFIVQMVALYGAELVELEGDIKVATARLLAMAPIKAIILGNRTTDPGSSHLGFLQLSDTDKGWPNFIRCHPILPWSYGDVWAYLGSRPYCKLYDEGYTSLGRPENTSKNELLRSANGYVPARRLVTESDQDERRGREDGVSSTPS